MGVDIEPVELEKCGEAARPSGSSAEYHRWYRRKRKEKENKNQDLVEKLTKENLALQAERVELERNVEEKNQKIAELKMELQVWKEICGWKQ